MNQIEIKMYLGKDSTRWEKTRHLISFPNADLVEALGRVMCDRNWQAVLYHHNGECYTYRIIDNEPQKYTTPSPTVEIKEKDETELLRCVRALISNQGFNLAENVLDDLILRLSKKKNTVEISLEDAKLIVDRLRYTSIELKRSIKQYDAECALEQAISKAESKESDAKNEPWEEELQFQMNRVWNEFACWADKCDGYKDEISQLKDTISQLQSVIEGMKGK